MLFERALAKIISDICIFSVISMFLSYYVYLPHCAYEFLIGI
jgi:hypothetical protein